MDEQTIRDHAEAHGKAVVAGDFKSAGQDLTSEAQATIVETNLPFGSADGGVQGLLGSDMLSQFDVITIDYGRQVLRLHHRAVKAHG